MRCEAHPKEVELPAPPCRRGKMPHLLVAVDCSTTPSVFSPSASPRSGETSRLAVSDAGRIRPPAEKNATSASAVMNPSVRYRGRTRRVATAVNGSSGQ